MSSPLQMSPFFLFFSPLLSFHLSLFFCFVLFSVTYKQDVGHLVLQGAQSASVHITSLYSFPLYERFIYVSGNGSDATEKNVSTWNIWYTSTRLPSSKNKVNHCFEILTILGIKNVLCFVNFSFAWYSLIIIHVD